MDAKEFLEKQNITDVVVNKSDLSEYWKTISDLMEDFSILKQQEKPENIKSYYYAIFHSWFVSSNGFDCKKIEAENTDEAYKKAKSINYDKDSTFNKTDFYLLEINNNETLKRDFDHKLTKIPRLIRWLYKAL